MAYDVAVFGTLKFKRGKFDAWKSMTIDSSRYRVIAKTFPEASHLPPVTVETLLAELPVSTGYGLFTLDPEGGALQVRGRLTKAAFDARCGQLMALFLQSADVGAEGDVCFLGEGVFVGYGVSVGRGKGVLMTLTEQEVQNASMSPELDVISGFFSVAEMVGPGSASAEETPNSRQQAAPKSLLELPKGPTRPR